MDLTVVTYVAYLLLTIPLTVWAARALHRYGEVFLNDVFGGDVSPPRRRATTRPDPTRPVPTGCLPPRPHRNPAMLSFELASARHRQRSLAHIYGPSCETCRISTPPTGQGRG